MSDEILGHDNLDHGKHLHHTRRRPEPGERFGRGSSRHVGLRTSKKEHYHHGRGGVHGHRQGDYTPSMASSHTNRTPERHSSSAPSTRHESYDEGNALRDFLRTKKWWLFRILGVLALFVLILRMYNAVTVIISIILINTILEQHKQFTGGVPLDIEILYVSSVYVAMQFGFGWAAVIALLGPVIADFSRGHLHADTTLAKCIGVLVAAGAGAILSFTPAELVFAILLGNITQYIILMSVGRTKGIMSVIRRFTTFGFNAYLAAYILPVFFRLGA